MTANPKNVMARIAPAVRVKMTQAKPIPASGAAMVR